MKSLLAKFKVEPDSYPDALNLAVVLELVSPEPRLKDTVAEFNGLVVAFTLVGAPLQVLAN
jgi:hypothetical protein